MYSLALKYLKSKDTQTINQGVAIFEKLIE